MLSVRNAQKVELGFESDHLLAASFDLDTRGYDEARGRQALASMVECARALPGVRSAAVAETLVLAGQDFPRTINVEGRVQKPGERLVIHPNSVDPGYFETMGIPLLRGRLLTAQDRAGGPGVAVINRTMADRYWNGDAVGRRFKLAATGETLQVVGVVRDVKYTGVDEKPRNAVYFPISQVYTGAVTLHVRTERDPALLAGPVRQAIQSVEPGLPLLDLRTMPQILDALFWVPRHGRRAARPLRSPDPGPGGDRDLRDHVLRGGRAPAGDRHPAGAGGREVPRRAPPLPREHGPGRGGSRAGLAAGFLLSPLSPACSSGSGRAASCPTLPRPC